MDEFKVCIIQGVLKSYRAPFFTILSEYLASHGITLRVVYGVPCGQEALRGDNVDLPPPLGTSVRAFLIAQKLLVMPSVTPWLTADLVIVEHANKHALNYLLALLNFLGLKKLAYWGHGRNRQGNSQSLPEKFKRRSLRWAQWWFAYTREAAEYVTSEGFSPERVTVVENAIDTRALRKQIDSTTSARKIALRQSLGWTADSQILVFCGSLYANKRLDILLDAMDIVSDAVPNARLLVIGGGELTSAVVERTANNPRIKYVGPKLGEEKAALLSLGELWLNPGVVGLGVLDAFCAGMPVLTTSVSGHGPEIQYLEEGNNAVIVDADAGKFSQAVIELLRSPDRISKLRQGAKASADIYSVEAMAHNFTEGIMRSLGLLSKGRKAD